MFKHVSSIWAHRGNGGTVCFDLILSAVAISTGRGVRGVCTIVGGGEGTELIGKWIEWMGNAKDGWGAVRTNAPPAHVRTHGMCALKWTKAVPESLWTRSTGPHQLDSLVVLHWTLNGSRYYCYSSADDKVADPDLQLRSITIILPKPDPDLTSHFVICWKKNKKFADPTIKNDNLIIFSSQI